MTRLLKKALKNSGIICTAILFITVTKMFQFIALVESFNWWVIGATTVFSVCICFGHALSEEEIGKTKADRIFGFSLPLVLVVIVLYALNYATSSRQVSETLNPCSFQSQVSRNETSASK